MDLYLSKCISGLDLCEIAKKVVQNLCILVEYHVSVLFPLFRELVLSAFCMCKNVNFQFPTVSFVAFFHDVNRVLQTLFMSYSHSVPHKKQMCLCYKYLHLINLLVHTLCGQIREMFTVKLHIQ